MQALVVCPFCEGQGRVDCEQCEHEGNACPYCNGSGYLPCEQCSEKHSKVLTAKDRVAAALGRYLGPKLAQERANNIAAALSDGHEDPFQVIGEALVAHNMPLLLHHVRVHMEAVAAWETVFPPYERPVSLAMRRHLKRDYPELLTGGL